MSAVSIERDIAGSTRQSSLRAIFNAQRMAFERDSNPPLQVRIDRLRRLHALIVENAPAIIQAVAQDFGHRSTEESRIAEIGGTVANIHYAIRNLRRWMRSRRRSTSIWFLPGSNSVLPQPLGVVGVMAPWNYPVNLAVAPLASALAAGNRAMVKMSELTPATTETLKRLIALAFDESEIAIIGGDAGVAAAFSSLPFDHLLFTGSTRVGRMVMAAAAQNLTPVTLELGGKCPVIVDADYPIEEAAHRILWGKTFNAGQTCVAPDYVLLPKGSLAAFASALSRHYLAHFPRGAGESSYSSVIDPRAYERLQSLVQGAREAGAVIQEIEQHTPDHAAARKFPLTLVINPPPDSRIMREEIFGPVLPVFEHDGLDDAIRRVNAGERPLGLYYFGRSSERQRAVLDRTVSGGVSINDVMLQFLQVDLPFGGVGASGFGRYHGQEGFETFSHLKPVFMQRGLGSFTGLKLLYPPYGNLARRLIGLMGG
ncbi:coniferyl aldehyde dehydrogenase [Solimonas sp. K1W22B-7]|uniref:coniferyl aldehyde dehydrogenase n=1 Tax=Solimonas sp. K1W22B-7 TaxID=2303331 RepID=UPI000E333BEC|nr:coniferyl aldehyde dehydrogenase [Solimonas sp. K1W22B-7]AXQ30528.1 coniferyl aldehyde dehydrogenase [Solimonas sp. K1W22B-7]